MKKQLFIVTASVGMMFSAFYSQASAHELNYKVQSGDTLWRIANSNNVSVQELKTWNTLNSNTIHVGQELTLIAPHTHEQVLKISNTQNSTVEPKQPSTTKTYVVQSGDTLWRIATKNSLTVNQLKSFNNLTSNNIAVGQVLKLTSDSAKTTPTPEVKPSLNVNSLIAEGKKYLGVPYVWGGSTPNGFDCSGFLNYVFGKVGVPIPRTVETIWSATKVVSTPQLGDLVFFTTYKAGPSHAGIYIGNNKFMHAGSSTGVTITDMNNPYWKARYLGAKKVNL